MIVVADTSPLNYLIRLGRADILSSIYGRVLIPGAVLLELQHPDGPLEVRAWAAEPPAWLEVALIEQLDSTLPAGLGVGEREAISLALEAKADVLLIDERAGREAASARQLQVAGTLAVLLQAALRGHVDFRKAVEQLQAIQFRASKPLVAALLAKFEESKKSSG